MRKSDQNGIPDESPLWDSLACLKHKKVENNRKIDRKKILLVSSTKKALENKNRIIYSV